MQLMGAEEVKDTKQKADAERQRHIDSMNREEREATARLNVIRDEEQKEREKSAKQASNDIGGLMAQRTILSAEVKSLEARKVEALRPIEKIRAEAEEILIDNIKRSGDIRDELESIAKQKENLAEHIEDFSDKVQIFDEKRINLDRREVAVAAAEDAAKNSAIAVGKEWVEFHDAIFKANKALDERAREITAKEHSVSAREATFAATALDLHRREVAVQDKYKQLERSIEEFEKKKNG